MGIPILDTLLMQRIAGQCLWIPRVSIFLAMLAAVFFMPVLQWFAIGVSFLCLARVLIRNIPLSRQVAIAAALSGKTFRYFNEKLLGTEQARKAMAEALKRDVRIALDRLGGTPVLRFTLCSAGAREAMALGCAVVYFYGDCVAEPLRDATGMTLKLKTGFPDAVRCAMYDRMLSELLESEVRVFAAAERVVRPTVVRSRAATERAEATVLYIGPDLRLELERTEEGIAVRSCSATARGERLVYANAGELLRTWGALLDERQQAVVERLGSS